MPGHSKKHSKAISNLDALAVLAHSKAEAASVLNERIIKAGDTERLILGALIMAYEAEATDILSSIRQYRAIGAE